MNIWFVLLLILHVFICLILVGLVLLQNDKGGGLAGALGGMGGGAAFTGGSAATFITKLTTWVALASFVVILGLNALAGRGEQRAESELKGAVGNKGLSTALPGTRPASPSGGIPGLGTEDSGPDAPAGSGAGSGAEQPPAGEAAD